MTRGFSEGGYQWKGNLAQVTEMMVVN